MARTCKGRRICNSCSRHMPRNYFAFRSPQTSVCPNVLYHETSTHLSKSARTWWATLYIKRYSLCNICNWEVLNVVHLLFTDEKTVPGSAPANSGSTGSQPESGMLISVKVLSKYNSTWPTCSYFKLSAHVYRTQHSHRCLHTL